MLDYGCPDCGRLLFRAPHPVDGIELPCKTHGIVTAVFRGHVVHYRCSKCGREQYCERPRTDRTYCIICGTPTLTVRPVEAPAPKLTG